MTVDALINAFDFKVDLEGRHVEVSHVSGASYGMTIKEGQRTVDVVAICTVNLVNHLMRRTFED